MKLNLFVSTAAVLFSAFSGSAAPLVGCGRILSPVCGRDGPVAYRGRCHGTNSDLEYYPEVEDFDNDFDSADYYPEPESEDYDFDYEDDEEEEEHDDVDFSNNRIASE